VKSLNYIPLLSVRPAEIVAITEAPELAKDRMLPFFSLRPWLGKGDLNRATDRIVRALGQRKWIAHLDMLVMPSDDEALTSLNLLRNDEGGYSNWISFVSTLKNAIPSPVLTNDRQKYLKQIDQISALGRGVAVRIEKKHLANVDSFIEPLRRLLDDRIFVIVDFGQQDRKITELVSKAAEVCRTVSRIVPNASLAVSSTTFPSSFEISEEEIYERRLHAQVAQALPSNTLIYSDYGSTRIRDEDGGSVPRPRIDLPTDQSWHFFRSELVREKSMSKEEYVVLKANAYKDMADKAVASRFWDPNLNIWGTQFIKITQLNTQYGINSPTKATACRINIHLTRQALYGSGLDPSSFDEDWVD